MIEALWHLKLALLTFKNRLCLCSYTSDKKTTNNKKKTVLSFGVDLNHHLWTGSSVFIFKLLKLIFFLLFWGFFIILWSSVGFFLQFCDQIFFLILIFSIISFWLILYNSLFYFSLFFFVFIIVDLISTCFFYIFFHFFLLFLFISYTEKKLFQLKQTWHTGLLKFNIT